MGCQVSIFEVRRCAFGDKLYGVAENYGREGVDVENWPSRPVRNIAPTQELESFGPSLRVKLSWYLPSSSYDFRLLEGNDDFSLAFCGGCSFQNFCSCPINYLPPEFSKACLRSIWGLKSFLFLPYSHFAFPLSVSSCFFLQQLVQTSAFFIFKVFSIAEMMKKKSCQNVRVPRVLSVAERELYGWVDEEIFTQPSVVEADALPELRREMRLTVDRAAEGDYLLEAASPSDRLPFPAQENRAHYLWVYTKLFTRLGVWLPFTDFQREVLSRCRVAASQLHLNGWGFLRTFEWVLPLPGKRPFWLDDEGAPVPWVYWNDEVGDFRVTALDPLETLAFKFLQSLPVGLGKKSNFKCRWILDHSDADVGAFLDSLLKDMEKQSRFDRLMQRMKEAEGAGPRSILLSSMAQTTVSGASASGPVAPASIPASSVPPAPSSGASKAAGNSTSATVNHVV
ncbi:hypothetical protein PIB30_089167, partial [Stylosanthes scabra]|nr:hypothetical protein [Stylosanthes scabra]